LLTDNIAHFFVYSLDYSRPDRFVAEGGGARKRAEEANCDGDMELHVFHLRAKVVR
jgi:hypothetical protein